MTRKEKRDRKNANHRKNEKRRGKVKSRKLFGPKNRGLEHPLLMAGFGVFGGIYRVYAADLTPLLLWRM